MDIKDIFFYVKQVVKSYLAKDDHHISKIADDAPWVYFSYIPEVYAHLDDEAYMAGHQNRQETVKMVDVFNELGYNVFLQNFTTVKSLPNINPKIVIGLEPNFNRACKKWPNAKKVFFATGAYYKHANRQITSMTDYINKTYGSHIPYRRMTKDHDANELSDVILQIGSSYTIATYPAGIQNKIQIIDQSSQGVTAAQKTYAPENEYLFMGSSGNVLKGVSLLIEYFSKHQDLNLHIVGPIEDDFHKAMSHLITPNIHLHGFLNVNGPEMKELVARSNFTVYPSGTEGCPGAVINLMKRGLIPIVTPWAAFDGLEDVGFVMREWSVDSLAEGIEWSKSLSKDEIEKRSMIAITISNQKYSLPRFTQQFKDFIANL